MLNMFNRDKQQQIAVVTAEAKLIARAMKDIWSHPEAYEMIRSQLSGREVDELSERELMRIIYKAINAVKSGY